METTRRFLDSFMATKSILIRLGNDEAKYYKNKRLVVLSKKLEEIDKSGQESNIHFSKNEMKIMDIFYNVYIDATTYSAADKMTQDLYNYIHERFYQVDSDEYDEQLACLCETGECCRKCCNHPGEVCVWNSRRCIEDDDNSMMNWTFGAGNWGRS